jgi:hypothetical protein
MADTFTTNLNLTKPELGAAEDTWGISLNADLDALDAIFSSSGTQINLNPNQVNFGDNKKAVFGAGSDLQIYHDGSNSIVQEVGTGDLRLAGNVVRIRNSADTENMISAVQDGAVTLCFDGNGKLSTTSTGINVTGIVENDGLRVDSTDSIRPTGDTSLITISGGNATNSGANYSLFGGTHATLPNIHRWRVGGSEAARIDASGNLGIGTSSPGQKLHVEGNVRLADAASIQFGSSFYQTITGTAGSNDLLYRTYANHIFKTATGPSDNTDGTERMRVNSTGIDVTGTATMDGLTIQGDNSATPLTVKGGTGSIASIDLLGGTNATDNSSIRSKYSLYLTCNSTNAISNRSIIFGNGTSEFARINSVGNFGIGTSSPTLTGFGSGTNGLEIADATLAGIRLNGNASDSMYFISGSGKHWLYGKGAVPMTFSTNGTEALRIDSNQNVGIGTSSPQNNSGRTTLTLSNSTNGGILEIFGASNTRQLLIYNTTGESRFETLSGGSEDLVFRPNGSEQMRVTSTGLGIGTSSLTHKFTANSSGNTNSVVMIDAADSRGAGRYALDIIDSDANSRGSVRISTTSGASLITTGNVGIGTSSPAAKLDIYHGSAHRLLFTTTGTDNFISSVNGANSAYTGVFLNGSVVKLGTGGSERARIDGSGNLLVGTTTVSLYNSSSEVGTRIGDGVLMVNRSANTPAYFNRLSTDGTIADFRKDGTSVGSIGANGGRLIVGSDDTYLFFDSGSTPSIRPHDGSAATSGVVDIGESGSRFKNLFLDGYFKSGSNVYIGKGSSISGSYGADDIVLDSEAANSKIIFRNLGGSESARIDGSGNFYVGTTNTTLYSATSGGGIYAVPNGSTTIARESTSSTQPLFILNETGVDGTLQEFRKDGTIVGSIGTRSTGLIVGNGDVGLHFDAQVDRIFPESPSGGAARDNAIDLGTSAARFKNIYATNGTIQTSDINEKQDIEDLTDAETRVAVAAKGLLKKYRWKSAVEEKGDDARIHFGIMAQDLQNAFTAEGLDAGDYGMFISTTWTNDDGVEQTRLGVRYNELLAFIIAVI